MARLASMVLALAILAGGAVFLADHDKAPSSCGVALWAQWSGRHIALDNCADQLIPPPAGITLPSGRLVTFDDNHQWSGFFSSNPAVVVERPRGDHVAVFQASAAGMATIRARAKDGGPCGSRFSKWTCNVLTITVPA